MWFKDPSFSLLCSAPSLSKSVTVYFHDYNIISDYIWKVYLNLPSILLCTLQLRVLDYLNRVRNKMKEMGQYLHKQHWCSHQLQISKLGSAFPVSSFVSDHRTASPPWRGNKRWTLKNLEGSCSLSLAAALKRGCWLLIFLLSSSYIIWFKQVFQIKQIKIVKTCEAWKINCFFQLQKHQKGINVYLLI